VADHEHRAGSMPRRRSSRGTPSGWSRR